MDLRIKSFFAAAFALPFLFSCTTLQQDVNIEQVSYDDEVVSFERRFSEIDAESLVPDADVNGKLLREQRVDDFLEDISFAIDNPSVQKAARARLLALKGEAELLSGSKSRAKSLCEESSASYKGDTRNVILSYRLGAFESGYNIEDSAPVVSEKPLLTLERAISLFKEKSYSDSAAKFDEAFLLLDPLYGDAYREIRDLAWNLRNAESGSDSFGLMTLQEISVIQMLKIARDKSDFLYNFTGGKSLGDKAFFNKVSAAGLLSPVSKPLDSENALGRDDVVTKFVTARFLWNLRAAKRNAADATKYSARLKKSPVGDVPADSPDFDAVLGCVENEYMSLEDGRNFRGDRTVSAVEFSDAVSKVE